MNFSLTAKPSTLVWSRNPVTFQFSWSGFTGEYRYVDFSIRNGIGPNADTLLLKYPLSGGVGTLNIEISDLLHTLVEANTKPTNLNTNTIKWVQKGWKDVRIEYRLAGAGLANNFTSAGDFRVLRGGVGKTSAADTIAINRLNNELLLVQTESGFLNRGRTVLVHPGQPNWIRFLCTRTLSDAGMKARYIVFYNDGTTTTIDRTFANITTPPPNWTGTRGTIWEIPTEPFSAGLTAAGKQVVGFDLEVWDAAVLERYAKIFCTVDYRPFQRARNIYWRNALGAWETWRFYGEREGSMKGTMDYAQVHPLYATSDTVMMPYNQQMTGGWKLHTGWMTRTQCAALGDILVTSSAAYLQAGQWVPLLPASNELKWEDTKAGNGLSGAWLEFITPGLGTNFPEQITQL